MKVFISYKREDSSHNRWVEKFANDLQRLGFAVSLDVWAVQLGESFLDYMVQLIETTDVFLFIMTEQSVAAVEKPGNEGAVKFEFQLALARQLAGHRVRIIGIYKSGSTVPSALRDRRYADFRDHRAYDQSLAELTSDLSDHKSIIMGRPLASPITVSPKMEWQEPSRFGNWEMVEEGDRYILFFLSRIPSLAWLRRCRLRLEEEGLRVIWNEHLINDKSFVIRFSPYIEPKKIEREVARIVEEQNHTSELESA